jgi:hypothetical protein
MATTITAMTMAITMATAMATTITTITITNCGGEVWLSPGLREGFHTSNTAGLYDWD